MSEAARDEAAAGAEVPGPALIHQGTYALYETPAGGRHVVFRRYLAADPDTGEVRDVDGGDEHLPDFPPEALPLLSRFIEQGIPPQILAVLQGKSSVMGLLAELRDDGGSDG
jgi:hypothetical protein